MTDVVSSHTVDAEMTGATGPTPTEPTFDAPTLGDQFLTPFVDGISGLRPHMLGTEQTLSLARTRVHFHRNLPALDAWGYGFDRNHASVPGPLLEADADHPAAITWRNRIGPPGPLPFTGRTTTRRRTISGSAAGPPERPATSPRPRWVGRSPTCTAVTPSRTPTGGPTT
jgi:hypothetical protein